MYQLLQTEQAVLVYDDSRQLEWPAPLATDNLNQNWTINCFFGRFLQRLSKIKRIQVFSMEKSGITVLSFGQGFWTPAAFYWQPFLRQPLNLFCSFSSFSFGAIFSFVLYISPFLFFMLLLFFNYLR